ncbi:DNA-binding transcriptional LysR family regulator [Neorhizobium sp. R1-B]|uniref:LysR family transcriptional regulator n=1 Tax=Neorhizobium sp. R1-B TaxID=2485162 RepID=UPI00106498FE|nr:LysR family transcriptional regulator [Neorhizobium sp. R1-B]TDX85053.1 DNA-binding transcriptional LysR family regulator [Neorhizobium sp. R1-B]
MQFELIETFLDLMETRSFNRTAERLNITQSTVSHRVNALEATFRRKLFVRGKGGTVPTVAGMRLLDHAKALQQQWHEAARAVEAAGAYERAMRIGIQHDVAEMFAGRFLRAVREELQGMSIYLEADYSNQMNRDLGAGDLDLAVLYTPHHLPDLHYERLGEISYILVSTQATTLSNIRQQDYIYANYSPAFDRAHRLALPQFSASPLSTGRNLMIAELITTLGGAAYVTRATAEDLVKKEVAQIVSDAPVIAQTAYAATNVRSRHSHQHRRLIATLAKLVAEERHESSTITES